MTNITKSILVLLVLFSLTSIAIAHNDDLETHNLSIENVLSEIREAQDVKSNEDINPDNVSDDLLEKLGEAVMNVQLTDPKEHEFMDNMMGGEGSESLKSMHKWMGYNYIKSGYDIDDSSYPGRGMMGPWMHGGWGHMMMGGMGSYDRDWFGHMGFGFHWGFWIIIILVLGAISATTITLVKKKSTQNNNNLHAIDILKRRLAKGEISKEDFNHLKQDVL